MVALWSYAAQKYLCIKSTTKITQILNYKKQLPIKDLFTSSTALHKSLFMSAVCAENFRHFDSEKTGAVEGMRKCAFERLFWFSSDYQHLDELAFFPEIKMG